ncbi:MAG TPA: hypothetical protein PLU22_03495 [Polyangiaceae bacterium]|nr:hypothetical protein [Polyangiaceae bacterium]
MRLDVWVPAVVPATVPACRPPGASDGPLRGVKRLAWGGDGRRGVARLELSAGSLAGAEIVVEVIGREVEVSIRSPFEAVEPDLVERLRARLGDRGLSLRSFDVT